MPYLITAHYIVKPDPWGNVSRGFRAFLTSKTPAQWLLGVYMAPPSERLSMAGSGGFSSFHVVHSAKITARQAQQLKDTKQVYCCDVYDDRFKARSVT